MKIKFKDGREIEFKRLGDIWIAENVIWEKTELNRSLENLRKLKVKISQWFAENASEEMREKYNARLPMREEIQSLSFKEQLAYREGKIDQVTDYFLGDEEHGFPVHCRVGISDGCCWFGCYSGYAWDDSSAVRLCLEEK